MLLSSIARFLDKYPGIRNSGENIRTAMTKLLEVALLIGGANASNMIAPGFGFFFIAGFYLLNEAAGRPIVRMAVGPVGAIARSEEHTSELQSRGHLVCRLLLEKKKGEQCVRPCKTCMSTVL